MPPFVHNPQTVHPGELGDEEISQGQDKWEPSRRHMAIMATAALLSLMVALDACVIVTSLQVRYALECFSIHRMLTVIGYRCGPRAQHVRRLLDRNGVPPSQRRANVIHCGSEPRVWSTAMPDHLGRFLYSRHDLVLHVTLHRLDVGWTVSPRRRRCWHYRLVPADLHRHCPAAASTYMVRPGVRNPSRTRFLFR